MAIVGAVAFVLSSCAAHGTPRLVGTRPPGPAPGNGLGMPTPTIMYSRGSGPAVVTPGVAGAIVGAFWTLRERALRQENVPLLRFLEAGPAADWDAANTKVAIDVGGPNEGGVMALLGSVVNVPYQIRYPAYFLAETQAVPAGHDGRPGDPATFSDLFVFRRSNAAAPWQMTNQAQLGGGVARLGVVGIPRPDPRHAGFAAAGGNAGGVAPGSVYPQLARYFQYWLARGQAPQPTPFVSGTWTTVKGASLTADGRRQDGIDPQGHAIEHIDYFADARDGVYAFALARGYVLVCSAFRGVERIVPPLPGASALYQDPARSGWGGLIPAGTYSSITDRFVHEGCTAISPTGRMTVLGTIGNDTSETGTPSDIGVPTPRPAGPGVVFRAGTATRSAPLITA